MFRSNPGLLWGLLFKWLAGMEIGKERRGKGEDLDVGDCLVYTLVLILH
jgi:hypothetical protein